MGDLVQADPGRALFAILFGIPATKLQNLNCKNDTFSGPVLWGDLANVDNYKVTKDFGASDFEKYMLKTVLITSQRKFLGFATL